MLIVAHRYLQRSKKIFCFVPFVPFVNVGALRHGGKMRPMAKTDANPGATWRWFQTRISYLPWIITA